MIEVKETLNIIAQLGELMQLKLIKEIDGKLLIDTIMDNIKSYFDINSAEDAQEKHD